MVSHLVLCILSVVASEGNQPFPTMYYERDGSLVSMVCGKHEQSLNLCVSWPITNETSALQHAGRRLTLAFQSRFVRTSVRGRMVWIIELHTAEFSPGRESGCSIINLDWTEQQRSAVASPCRLEVLKPPQPKSNSSLSEPESEVFDRILNDAIRLDSQVVADELPSTLGADEWHFVPYDRIPTMLWKSHNTRGYEPLFAIGAIDDRTAIAALYIGRRIALMRLSIEDLDPSAGEPLQGAAGSKGEKRRLRCEDLGVVATNLTTWATGFVRGDRVIFVSDRGEYECIQFNGKQLSVYAQARLSSPIGFYEVDDHTFMLSIADGHTASPKEYCYIDLTSIPAKIDPNTSIESRRIVATSLDDAVVALSKSLDR